MVVLRRTMSAERELAVTIIRRLEREMGAELLPVFVDGTLSVAEKRRRAVHRLMEAALRRVDGGAVDTAFLEAFVRDSVEIEPNIVVLEKEAARLKALAGPPIKEYLFTLTERMEQMAEATSPAELALRIVTGGLISVGGPMAVGTIGALRAGQALAAALRIAVVGIGLKTAVGTVIIVLVGLLLWLFLENPKKVLGLILNDTDETLVVRDWRAGVDGRRGGNLWMKHGFMQNFMQDYQDADLTKKIQINARASFGKDDPDNAVYGGMYFANKNFGLRGAEGVMLVNSTTTPLLFAHMFAVPYVRDNGTNVTFGVDGYPERLFQRLYDTRRVRVTADSGRHHLTATMNDPRGGIVGCIASITAR